MKASTRIGALLLGSTALLTSTAHAQTPPDELKAATASENDGKEDERDSSGLFGDIIVTGTKQSGGQRAQSAPVAISAFGSEQVDALNATDLQAFQAVIPNAQFGVSGFSKSANFSLRGLGITSSTPSTDPAVGVFVDGVYIALNQGVLTDTFDIESVEVLRGPQGILFGRNVTGGAVLLNHKRPSATLEGEARIHVESGPDYGLQAAAGGPVGGDFSARISVQARKNEGYFRNTFLGTKVGKDRSIIVRPSLRYNSGAADIVLFLEHGDQRGDGPVSTIGRDTRDVQLNDNGFSKLKWTSATLQGDFDVTPGDGTITNIFGYRKLAQDMDYDTDGSATPFFSTSGLVKQWQASNELRYNGTFGPVTVTTGLYYFHQNIKFLQQQRPGASNVTQGGTQNHDALGLFTQFDIVPTEGLTLQLGGRYSYEDKRVLIASLGRCDFAAATCNWQFDRKRADEGFTPKIGINYKPTENILLYATAQKALRSGGFSLRYNSPIVPQGFGPEKQDAFEVGFKSDLFDRRTRLNANYFHSKIRGLQRDNVAFEPGSNTTVNTTRNSADARIQGFEVELVQTIVDGLTINGSLGYVDAKFTKVLFDLSGDGVVNGTDLALKLPRAPKWTYSFGAQLDQDLDIGRIAASVFLTHTDISYYNDANTGVLPANDLLNGNLSFSPNDRWTFSIYGRNLLDEFVLDAATPLPGGLCACFPRKGRTVGAEVSFKY